MFLSLIVFCPLFLGSLLFFLPKAFLNRGALIFSLVYFFITLNLFFLFNSESFAIQLVEERSLIPFLGMKYFLGVDGISFWYVLLTAFLLPLTVLCSWKKLQPSYFFLLFALCTTVTGAFLSFDSLLFFLFFELSLFPLFFLIYLWGGEKRKYAAFKFLIYTFLASLFMLVGLVSLMLLSKQAFGFVSFSLLDFYKLDLVFVPNGVFNTQTLLFFCFALAFAVKTPLFPFHTWLPLAHVEAPTAGSVYLAAVILKLGTYGWFRFVLPLFPEASTYYSPHLLFLACFGVIYASLVALVQKDMKKLVAYSSVAHMAFVLIGLFAFNIYGLMGGFYQTLSHGLSSAALFLLVGVLYERTQSRQIADYGGLAAKLPWLAVIFFIVTLSSIGLPLTAGFVSEFLALLGSFVSGKHWVWVAIVAVVLSAVYMLNLFQKLFLGSKTSFSSLKDLNAREISLFLPIVILILMMGIFPSLFLRYSKASLKHLNENRFNYQLIKEIHHKEEVSCLKCP